jgi:hypothetical protein
MKRKTKALAVCLLPALVYLLTLGSCKKPPPPFTGNYQYYYYPIDSPGRSVIYNVDSILFSYNGAYTRDTVHYQWMEVIGDTFYDNLNQLNRKLVFYRRADSSQAWTFDRQWYAYRTTTNLQINEDDLRFVKLIFPPTAGATWNGNLYIPSTPLDQYQIFSSWNYYYENTDTSFTLNGNNLSNMIIVSEVNSVNLLNKTVRTEMYAPNIGLVYQEWEGLTKQNTQVGWDSGAENGFSVHMYLVSHNP